MRKWLLQIAAAVLVSAAPCAFAQNAQIAGSVKDETGGVLPGATVTVRNLETGLVRTATSDAAGNYRLPALPPGMYSLQAQMQGFSSETRPDVLLVIDQTATIPITLKPKVAETL